MSNSTPPSGGERGAPKQLSSRLMTMKFMQRAAASVPSSSGPNPPSPSASSPSSSKRLKTSHAADPAPPRSGPSTGTRTPAYPAAPAYLGPNGSEVATPPAGDGAIDWRREARNAADAEEARRQAALERAGSGVSGETRWVLRTEGGEAEEQDGREVEGLKVVRFGEADASEEDQVEEPWRGGGAGAGRMRFGKWKVEEAQAPANNSSGANEDDFNSDSDASNYSDEQQSATLRNKSRNSFSKATKPHETGVGISSGGGSGGGGGRPRAAAKEPPKCYRCGQVGHIKSQCPKTPQSITGAACKARG